ncbi:AAA family ATPase [Bacteroides acidifaciens]|uniref:Uncharacterized protein n=2 Tax=Bacteroides acidifaciens TaxID=85831 RepID=A0A7K3MDU7_9BACE|nr:AAA family ATPase [Bacteroides acidifaciens]MBF0729257.1 AAA family ATPase [Bacteroides acidifaciens]MBF0837398.1 AAA family ATPase [Bacteroides acidifaciens]NDO52690.1 AAA family ATPase [Bacteroides acidifaciens]TFU50515.1 hypothetical protein E4T97_06755 [Bacteroides acidifaciens]
MEEDKNYINMIHGDLARASQVQSGMPENVGVMNIKTANRTILEASQKPTPRSLWDCFWYEGELSCLFADSNVGKSILAVQIADRIAQTDNVLYLDFELSEKQFQLRYTNEHGNLYSFPERLYRVSLDCDSLLDANFEEAIIGSIEQMALQTGGKSQMKEDKLRVLSGRTVLLFPDADGYSEWKQRAESMTYCKAIVSDLLEKHATPKQKADHIDIADWIIFQIQEGKLMSTANHLVEAEKILQQMIEKNPVLQKLIDELDLVLVDASHIASDDKSPP